MEVFQGHLAYQEIDAFIALPGLVFSALPRTRKYRDFRAFLASVTLTALIYLVWDALAVKVGTWGFNPAYVMPFRIFGLPIEEVEFFFAVPLSSLVFYELLEGRLRFELPVPRVAVTVAGVLVALSSLAFLGHSYTSVVLVYLGASLVLSSLIDPGLFRSPAFWAYQGLTFVPFFVFDYFLTSLPVVIYGPNATLGIRILTIPVEDSLYSFSMLTFYATFYRVLRRGNKGGRRVEVPEP